MIIDTIYDIGQEVYFVNVQGMLRNPQIEKGTIIGFNIFKNNDIRAVFKNNSVSIEGIFLCKEDAGEMMKEATKNLKKIFEE